MAPSDQPGSASRENRGRTSARGSSSANAPASTCCSTRTAVICFVVEPICRMWSGVIGTSSPGSAVPKPSTQVNCPCSITATDTPSARFVDSSASSANTAASNFGSRTTGVGTNPVSVPVSGGGSVAVSVTASVVSVASVASVAPGSSTGSVGLSPVQAIAAKSARGGRSERVFMGSPGERPGRWGTGPGGRGRAVAGPRRRARRRVRRRRGSTRRQARRVPRGPR